MYYVSKQCGLWLVCVYVLAGCISISPTVPTSTPTMELPALRPTSTVLPAKVAISTTTVITTHSAQTGVDAATFIKETYPDYSALTPGAKFVKTWDIKNIGTNTWNANYVLVLDATPQNNSLGSPAVINFP